MLLLGPNHTATELTDRLWAAVDLPHAAFANEGCDVVTADAGADGQGHAVLSVWRRGRPDHHVRLVCAREYEPGAVCAGFGRETGVGA